MAELNKVPGLLPRRMAMSASTTVIYPDNNLFKSDLTLLTGAHWALSIVCINWCYFIFFSLVRHLVDPWGCQYLVGETQSVCPAPTHGPAHKWTDPPAQL